MTSVTHKFKDVSIFEIPRDGFFSASHDIQKNLSGTTACRKLKIHQDSFVGRSQRMVKRVNLIDKPHTDLGNYLMLTWKFVVHVNRLLMELEGLVIEKTEVAYLKSFPCIVVKKTFQITCGVASFQIQKMKLILFCRLPASSRRQQISIILQFAPHIDVG